MAERPIFLPQIKGQCLVETITLPMQWHAGFAPIQKERNVQELHKAATKVGIEPVMEISTKSGLELGRQLSAFNLLLQSERYGWLPIECVFQGSKVFEYGGPFQDLYHLTPREARSDERLRNSGKIVAFEFDGERFSNEPKTLFYDWIYLAAIYINRDLLQGLTTFEAFSDIEFNPSRSINCQARSVALFVSLLQRNLLFDALESARSFQAILLEHNYNPDSCKSSSSKSEQLEMTA